MGEMLCFEQGHSRFRAYLAQKPGTIDLDLITTAAPDHAPPAPSINQYASAACGGGSVIVDAILQENMLYV